MIAEKLGAPFKKELSVKPTGASTVLGQAGVEENKKQALTSSVMGGWALGEDVFMQSLQPLTKRRIHKAKAGRPMGENGLV